MSLNNPNTGALPYCNVYNSGNITLQDATQTMLTFDTDRKDAMNMHFTSAANLTGTVDKAASSATLAGTGTAFLTEISVGQMIVVPGTADEVRVVTAIASDTSLTVNSAFANTATGQTAARKNTGIVCRLSGRYLISANIRFAVNGTGIRYVRFRINGTTTIAYEQRTTNASDEVDIAIQRVYDLALYDYVEIPVYQNRGGTLDVVSSGNWTPEFTMTYLGPSSAT